LEGKKSQLSYKSRYRVRLNIALRKKGCQKRSKETSGVREGVTSEEGEGDCEAKYSLEGAEI